MFIALIFFSFSYPVVCVRFNKIKRIRCFCCVVLLAHVVWTKKREESNRLTVQSIRGIKKGKEEKREELPVPRSHQDPTRLLLPCALCRVQCQCQLSPAVQCSLLLLFSSLRRPTDQAHGSCILLRFMKSVSIALPFPRCWCQEKEGRAKGWMEGRRKSVRATVEWYQSQSFREAFAAESLVMALCCAVGRRAHR